MKFAAITVSIALFALSSLSSASVRTVSGVIVGINPTSNTVSIKSDEKKLITYRYVDGIKVENTPAFKNSITDLKEGERVELTLEPIEN